MTDLQIVKHHCELFMREALRVVYQNLDAFPNTSCYILNSGGNQNRGRFIEDESKNLWFIPKKLINSIFGTHQAQQAANILEISEPFSLCIGKKMYLVGFDYAVGRNNISGLLILDTMLISFLLHRTSNKWSKYLFNEIWEDSLRIFDLNNNSVTHTLYAPIHSVDFHKLKIKLTDSVEIRRLSDFEVSFLASHFQGLRGFPINTFHVDWPKYYLIVKNIAIPKVFQDEFIPIQFFNRESYRQLLNEELSYLRCLLSKNISITNFEFVPTNKCWISQIGGNNELPWRAGLNIYNQKTICTLDEVNKYIRQRRSLLKLKEQKENEGFFESIKRFAVSWENPFNADVLADLVAALEKLVVRDDKEVSYKLRVRVSHFLAKSPLEQKEIYNNIKRAYFLRSQIFHGGYHMDENDLGKFGVSINQNRSVINKINKNKKDVERLIPIIKDYYLKIMIFFINNQIVAYDWESKSL